MKKRRRMTRRRRRKQLIQHVAVFLAIVFLFVFLPVRHVLSGRAAKTTSAESAKTGEAAAQNTGSAAAQNTGSTAAQNTGSTAAQNTGGTADPNSGNADAENTGSGSLQNTGSAAGGNTTVSSAADPSGSAGAEGNEDPASGREADKEDPDKTAGSAAASSGEETNSMKAALAETRQDVVIRAEEIEAERNKPTEEELRQQERNRLSAMELDELTQYLWDHDVPADLIYFMDEYPETREFVTDYLYQPDTPPSKSIAGEVTKGRIPHFLQWDERWGYETYGSTFLAVSGCGPTALSEVYSGLTGKTDMNPYAMAQWAEENGFYVYGSGTAWEMMTSGAWMLGLNAWSLDGGSDSLLWALRSGYPVICAMNPGDFTYFGHFIVLISADDDGNIRLLDSNSRIRTQKLWHIDDLMWQIAGMWAFSYDG